MASQQLCLKWNNHMHNMLAIFKDLYQTKSFVDVTLACDGSSMEAHKMVLSACSDFFYSLFIKNPCKHPVIILKDIAYKDLKSIVDFMYHGEVNVLQSQLPAFLKTAETLKVKGLITGVNDMNQRSGQPNPHQALHIPELASLSLVQQGRPQQQQRSKFLPPVHCRHKETQSHKRSNSRFDHIETQVMPIKINEEHPHEMQEVQDSNILQTYRSSSNMQPSVVHSRPSSSFEESEYYEIGSSQLLEQSLNSEDVPSSMLNAGSSGGIQVSEMVGDSSVLVPTSNHTHVKDLFTAQDKESEIPFDEQPSLLSRYINQSLLHKPSTSDGDFFVPQESHNQIQVRQTRAELANVSRRTIRDHDSRKKYTCTHCSYSTRWMTDLKKHIQSHAADRPHPCVICGKRFLKTENFKLHLTNHFNKKTNS